MTDNPLFSVSPGGKKHELLVHMLNNGGYSAEMAEEDASKGQFYIAPACKDVKKLLSRGIMPIEYLKRRDFKEKNGVLTAEAAIACAITETDFALSACRALVIGSGCIAKPLARRLAALGAFVTVAARDTHALSLFRMEGINTCELCFLDGDCDIIFNTVPAQVLGSRELSKISRRTVVIDLASLPGGVDKTAAETLGIKVVPALALPGKYCPESAAKVIFESVMNAVKETKL